MWERAELKERAKVAFKRNYWRCVAVTLILTILFGDAGNSVNSQVRENNTSITSIYERIPNVSDASILNVLAIFLGGMVLVAIVIGFLLRIFIFNPIEVGADRFFIKNSSGKPTMGELLFAFGEGEYGKIGLTLFLRDLFGFLWTLLLIIPGIIKLYEYRMIPYILADDPTVSRQDAFRISKEMMDGQKLDVFVLDLSFLGWSILSICTLGLLDIFYVGPYKNATDAELFLKLKQNYIGR